MRALCDQFRQPMAPENEALLFDNEAGVRIGQMIGSAVRQGGSEFGYPRQR